MVDLVERVVIEGGLIRHERIETLAESSLEAIAGHLVRRIATTLPVLPSRPVRYTHFDGETGRGMFLVEVPPALRHIRVWHNVQSRYIEDAARRDREGNAIWRVQFPWQYFAFPFTSNVAGAGMTNFVIDGTYLYWSREQFRRVDQPLSIAACPNVDGSGGICWGSTRADNSSLDARIDDYINNFTTTTFNEDLGHRTPFDTSLTQWEANSPEGSMAWTDWPYWDQASTIQVANMPFQRPQELPPMAELNPAFIDIPTPPDNFTIQRARQYLDSLSPAARQRFTAALNYVEETEEVTT